MSISGVGAGRIDGVSATQIEVRQTSEVAKVMPDAQSQDAPTPGKSMHVDLSDVAQMILQPQGGTRKPGDNQDIDDSSLPMAVKEVLKRIRELKEQLESVQREIASVQANSGTSPEQKNAQLQQLQAQSQTLSAALSAASGALGKLMKEQALPKEQLATVASLMSA